MGKLIDINALSEFKLKLLDLVGANNGIAGLDSNGKIPSSQLPSYVDDVLEYATHSNFPLTGETGKIYVALDTGKIYRWSGSEYVEISNPDIMSGATASSSGTAGLVPAPASGDQGKFLRGDGTWQTALTTHQDISGKKNVQTAVSDPTASGNALSFIDAISQDTQGVITASKKNVSVDSAPTQNSTNPITSGAAYDSFVATQSGIAIMATGNTHAAITSGQYVFVRNHGTLAEGLYQASANIAQNAALSASNLTAVSGGGLNALNSNLTSLSEQIGTLDSKVVGIDISNNADLNNYTTPGTYTINSAGIAQSLSHRPWNLISNAILEVKKAGKIVIQIVHENYYGHLVQRDYDGTSWSNWYAPVHNAGRFSGNQTLDSLRTNVEDTGKLIGYMVDSLITGWSTIETYVSPGGTYKSIKVTNASKIVYTQTSNGGTSWTTGSVALS